MSSYRTHLPDALPTARVMGLGMNAEEMRQNPQLDECVVQNLNKEPRLSFANEEFDAALCTVSVQYLTRPVEVFAEVARVLKPGAPLVVSFSNRCFPSKAVQIWLATNDTQHRELVRSYFEHTAAYSRVELHDLLPVRWWGDPLYVVTGYRTTDVL
ncbi:MAG: class I SAM-dependent methyltransferase [Chloroflexaceae bacterium]|nr:class I SAM-dependent methyltransferase [Chloroflexaceae bacterium]